MLFNSFAFAVFLPIVMTSYWALGRLGLRWQNALLFAASYTFYGWWDYRFLSLLLFTSTADFLIGIGIDRSATPRGRKVILAFSILVNLGVLGIFKYYDFFAASLARLGGWDFQLLHVILPVGISFYTFQSMSYTIDVYRRDVAATRDFLSFLAFVSFFPQLVAGPIERGAHLLPQFFERKRFDLEKARDGLRQALWGLFKKVVIADNLAQPVDRIFTGYAALTGPELMLGAMFFSVQIYCDFSGYSDMAIGVGRLFGISLMQNFRYPYFARNIQDFWRRWHISLSSWFRDYLYFPLGGNRKGALRAHLGIFVVFLVSGLWHGANWTFLVWGLLHGLLYIAYSIFFKSSSGREVGAAWVRRYGGTAFTFAAVSFLWIFFRAKSMDHATAYIAALVRNPWEPAVLTSYAKILALCAVVFGVEWWNRNRAHGFDVAHLPLPARWASYYALTGGTIWWGNTSYVPFIYFAF